MTCERVKLRIQGKMVVLGEIGTTRAQKAVFENTKHTLFLSSNRRKIIDLQSFYKSSVRIGGENKRMTLNLLVVYMESNIISYKYFNISIRILMYVY